MFLLISLLIIVSCLPSRDSWFESALPNTKDNFLSSEIFSFFQTALHLPSLTVQPHQLNKFRFLQHFFVTKIIFSLRTPSFLKWLHLTSTEDHQNILSTYFPSLFLSLVLHSCLLCTVYLPNLLTSSCFLRSSLSTPHSLFSCIFISRFTF